MTMIFLDELIFLITLPITWMHIDHYDDITWSLLYLKSPATPPLVEEWEGLQETLHWWILITKGHAINFIMLVKYSELICLYIMVLWGFDKTLSESIWGNNPYRWNKHSSNFLPLHIIFIHIGSPKCIYSCYIVENITEVFYCKICGYHAGLL